MTSTKHRFANNFELGAIQNQFEEIQEAYERIANMKEGDAVSFRAAVEEIHALYADLQRDIFISKSWADKAIEAEWLRLFPAPA